MPVTRITGAQSRPDGEVVRVEVEVQGGVGRVRFAQAPGPIPKSQLGALVVDDVPVAVVLDSLELKGTLVLPGPGGDALPAVPPVEPALDDDRVLLLRPLLHVLGDGLYTVSLSTGGVLPKAPHGFTAGSVGLVELGAAAAEGAPVLASLGGGARVLLAGREAAARGQRAWVLHADVILDAPGFVPRMHDRGAREAFARSPTSVLEDRALRDAVASLHATHPASEPGPFTEDRIEPAAQQARALVWDLRAEDGIESVSDPWRETAGALTEFRARARVKSVTFELGFASRDGRHIDEVVVRSGPRFRATGLRPAARGLARTLRQLADEGA